MQLLSCETRAHYSTGAKSYLLIDMKSGVSIRPRKEAQIIHTCKFKAYLKTTDMWDFWIKRLKPTVG